MNKLFNVQKISIINWNIMKPTWCTCDHWGLCKGVKSVARNDVVLEISSWQTKQTTLFHINTWYWDWWPYRRFSTFGPTTHKPTSCERGASYGRPCINNHGATNSIHVIIDKLYTLNRNNDKVLFNGGRQSHGGFLKLIYYLHIV